MKNGMAVMLLGMTLVASPAAAQTVLLQDNFDSERPVGTSSLNYNGFANWNVQGTVDLIAGLNGFGISCVAGACVDLSGSTNLTTGGLTSKLAYSFSAGDVMRMEFRVSGNQRIAGNTDALRFGASFTGSPNLTGVSTERNGVLTNLGDKTGPTLVFGSYNFLGSDPFVTVAFQFTAQSDGTAQFQITTASQAANIGPIVDNVTITRTSAAVPEPASALLVVTGLAGLAAARKRRTSTR